MLLVYLPVLEFSKQMTQFSNSPMGIIEVVPFQWVCFFKYKKRQVISGYNNMEQTVPVSNIMKTPISCLPSLKKSATPQRAQLIFLVPVLTKASSTKWRTHLVQISLLCGLNQSLPTTNLACLLCNLTTGNRKSLLSGR